MTMTTLESWRVITENEHHDVQHILDDWESEQQAALLTEKELEDKIAQLLAALEGLLPDDRFGLSQEQWKQRIEAAEQALAAAAPMTSEQRQQVQEQREAMGKQDDG